MTKYITTTLNKIRDHGPCEDGWIKLLKHLGKTKADDEPLDLLTVLESNGLEDALWCLRALPDEHDQMMHGLACDFAERALRFVPADEPRPAAAIAAKRAWVRGEITDEQLAAARAAAWDAAWDAAWAARSAAWAAADAAWAAAWDAGAAAWDAAWDARDAELAWQTAHFRSVLMQEKQP